MSTTRNAIVDAAVELAKEASWEEVRLYDIAERLDVPLTAVQAHFREKEEIAEAWFDRPDHALVAAASDPAVQALPATEKLHCLIMTWLDAQADHQRVVREMIKGKLEAGHVHVQIPAVLRISRTVQWLREAAHRDAAGAMRGLEETVLTSIFVTTFVSWLNEDTHDFRRTRARLSRLLHGAAWMAQWVPGYHSPRPRGALPAPPQGALRPENVADGSTDARA